LPLLPLPLPPLVAVPAAVAWPLLVFGFADMSDPR
jgi:hypothetical protein